MKAWTGWSYQLRGGSHCPGCDAIQPDEIQGMFQMANMDCPQRLTEDHLKALIAKVVMDTQKAWMKEMFLDGNGFKPKGKITRITAPE